MHLVKSSFLLPFLLFGTSMTVSAQYYYRDVVLTQQNQEQQRLFRKEKVSMVKLSSFESTGEATVDFLGEQIPNTGYTRTRTFIHSRETGPSSLTSYYNNSGWLYRMVDSNQNALVNYDYQYDSSGRLTAIVNNSNTFGEKAKETEAHYWAYDEKGKPSKMWRVKNGKDSIEVRFRIDEQGQVAEEQSFRSSRPQEIIYYYYDSVGRMTDVVRYHARLKRLLPDYSFEYEQEHLSQMLILQQGGSEYIIWRYNYDERGLKVRELCYNKQKKLMGRVEYAYSFK